LKVTRKGDELEIKLKANDPILKELAKALKKAGRHKECDDIQAAGEEPPSDPGGE
jgi:hypothetical protein